MDINAMTTVIIVIAILAALASGIAAAAAWAVRRQEKKRYYEAAKKIIQEEYLNSAIRNPENGSWAAGIWKTMVYLKAEGEKHGGFVFDPEDQVRIGRNRSGNEICLPDVRVSGEHCRLFLYEGYVFAEDLGSSNGTFIRHRRGKIQQLSGTPQQMFSGDRLYEGDTCLKLVIFQCNVAAM